MKIGLRPFNSRLSICCRVTSFCTEADSVCRLRRGGGDFDRLGRGADGQRRIDGQRGAGIELIVGAFRIS